jgi:hypothetical protein
VPYLYIFEYVETIAYCKGKLVLMDLITSNIFEFYFLYYLNSLMVAVKFFNELLIYNILFIFPLLLQQFFYKKLI